MTVGQIRAHNFSVNYAGRSRVILNRINCEIPAGKKILLTGDSGSGKSTFLMAIAGILDPESTETSGILDVEGSVGMVLQDPDSQVIAARVGDDVAFGCENLAVERKEIWQRVRHAVEAVGVDVDLDYPTRQLSGGQKQRLALAGVVAMQPDIIVLDEPTANLDPQGAAEIVSAVSRVAENTDATVIIVEHRGHQWRELVDEIWRLEDDLHVIEKLPALPDLPPARTITPGARALLTAEEVQTRVGPAHSLELAAGFSTVITGPNGSGKSTLLATLAGLIRPLSGKIRIVDGGPTPVWRWPSSVLAQRIGYVSQDPEHHFIARSVKEEISLGAPTQARADELLERLGLDHLAQANPFSLSGGEKRRLSVAAALVTKPEILLLDEPTFGQDERTFVELVSLLRELADAGVAVASITHDEAFIDALGDQKVRL